MKQLVVIVVVILSMCALTSLAYAGGGPPKSVCYELTGSGYYNNGGLILNFKNSGTKTKTGPGTTKFYHVTGAIGFGTFLEDSISGTAYWFR